MVVLIFVLQYIAAVDYPKFYICHEVLGSVLLLMEFTTVELYKIDMYCMVTTTVGDFLTDDA